jgi:hypothetical protein
MYILESHNCKPERTTTNNLQCIEPEDPDVPCVNTNRHIPTSRTVKNHGGIVRQRSNLEGDPNCQNLEGESYSNKRASRPHLTSPHLTERGRRAATLHVGPWRATASRGPRRQCLCQSTVPRMDGACMHGARMEPWTGENFSVEWGAVPCRRCGEESCLLSLPVGLPDPVAVGCAAAEAESLTGHGRKEI